MTGEVKIALSWPITVGGVETAELTMRRPRVRDMRAAQEQSGDSGAKYELLLLGNLLELTPDEIDLLDIEDYGKLQTALAGFTTPRSKKSGRGR